MNSLLMDLKCKQLFAVQFAKVTHTRTETQRGSTRCVLKVALLMSLRRHWLPHRGRREGSELSVAPPVVIGG